MACPQRSGNTISFDIPDHYKATVVVCFTGSSQKQIEVNWGIGPAQTVGSCDAGVLPGVYYGDVYTNNAKMDLSATVKVSYQDILCAQTPSPSGWQPMAGGNTLLLNCNPNLNLIVVGAWEFHVSTAQGNDTVQVTVVVEDVNWTEV